MAFGDFTVTRASTKNVLGSAGTYVSVANNVPAFEFNTDGSYRGLLVEPGATNLALNSRNLTTASWSATNVTTAQTATGADGGANSATTLTASAGNGTVLQAITSASASRVFSAVVRRRTGTGTVEITQDNGSTWTAITLTTSFQRFTTSAQTLTNPTVGFRIVTSGDAIDVDFCQAETGPVATSPIVTTGSTASRVADVVTLTGASSLIGQTAGTIFFDGFIEKRNDSAFALAISNGASLSEAIYIQQATSGNISGLIRSGGNTLNLTFLSANWTAGRAKVAVVYEAGTNKCVICVNGGTPVKGTATAIPTCGIVTIGSRADSPGGLAITNAVGTVALFPTPLTDAQIIALTTL
jgi:hypothetical protein